jgi:hypothetical protein
MGVGGQRHAPFALPPAKRPGAHCTGGWVFPRSVWTGAENIAPTGIRFLDRPFRSDSLYRLSCRGPQTLQRTDVFRIVSTINGDYFRMQH